jgi:hypothetical protein
MAASIERGRRLTIGISVALLLFVVATDASEVEGADDAVRPLIKLMVHAGLVVLLGRCLYAGHVWARVLTGLFLIAPLPFFAMAMDRSHGVSGNNLLMCAVLTVPAFFGLLIFVSPSIDAFHRNQRSRDKSP